MTRTNQPQPTRLDWLAWREGPVGKWFFNVLLEDEMRGLEQQLGEGGAHKDTIEATALAYTRVSSVIEGIALVHSLEPFQEETDESNSDRQTPSSAS